MSINTPSPKSKSLLTSRLPGKTPLIKIANEKNKWRIIAETIVAMYKSFDTTLLENFDSMVFKMYQEDLIDIIATIDDLRAKKYLDIETILKKLENARIDAARAAVYYKKEDIDAGFPAAVSLKKNLKDAWEYIEPIYKNLNPELNNKPNATQNRVK